jgi:dTMP kinase
MFISFEGIDGCGKSTQLQRLVDWLTARGIEPVCVREPGGTAIGERLREALLDPATGDLDDRTEALMYAASRAELVATVIKPALEAGQFVIADRFVDSSIAYQGAGRAIGVEDVAKMNGFAIDGTMPDLTLLFAVSVDEASARRAAARGGDDRIEAEGRAFLDRVAFAYGALAEQHPERIVVIDAARDVDSIAADVATVVEQRLAANGMALGVEQQAVQR